MTARLLSMFAVVTTLVAVVLVVAPVMVVVFVAFSAGDFFAFPLPGISTRWFVAFFADAAMLSAFALSITLALLAACSATILGLLAALALARRPGRAANALALLFVAPLVFPTIVLGLALLVFFRSIGIGTWPGLLIAHTLVGIPYAFRAALASLQSFDPVLEEAGASLAASPFATFRLITLPNIRPGVLAGFLFAFVVSFGELNTSLFLTGPGVTTLPIEIFSRLQFEGSQLVIAAASALQVGLVIVMVLIMERLIGLSRILER
jgi:putative spermidine/putrescine transport system permease protein